MLWDKSYVYPKFIFGSQDPGRPQLLRPGTPGPFGQNHNYFLKMMWKKIKILDSDGAVREVLMNVFSPFLISLYFISLFSWNCKKNILQLFLVSMLGQILSTNHEPDTPTRFWDSFIHSDMLRITPYTKLIWEIVKIWWRHNYDSYSTILIEKLYSLCPNVMRKGTWLIITRQWA